MDGSDKENENVNVVKDLGKTMVVDDGMTAQESNMVKDSKISTDSITTKKKIFVSNTKKPFSFYLGFARSCIKQYKYVELSALGTAIPTVVKLAVFLKRDGLATEKKISISTYDDSEENDKGYSLKKSKIEILLEKVDNLDLTDVANDFVTTATAIE